MCFEISHNAGCIADFKQLVHRTKEPKPHELAAEFYKQLWKKPVITYELDGAAWTQEEKDQLKSYIEKWTGVQHGLCHLKIITLQDQSLALQCASNALKAEETFDLQSNSEATRRTGFCSPTNQRVHTGNQL